MIPNFPLVWHVYSIYLILLSLLGSVSNTVAINPVTSWIVSYKDVLYLYHKTALRKLPSHHLQETIDSLFANTTYFPKPHHARNSSSLAAALYLYPKSIQTLSEADVISRGIKIGTDIPVLVMKDKSLDDILHINIASIFALQETTLFHNISDLDYYINPSLIFFQNRWLMATCASWSFPGMLEGKLASNTIWFKWVEKFTPAALQDMSTFVKKVQLPARTKEIDRPPPLPPIPRDRTYLGLSVQLEYMGNYAISGQDPRLLLLDHETILITFTHERKMKYPGLAVVSIDSASQQLKVNHVIQEFGWMKSLSEKNWVPFYSPKNFTSYVNENKSSPTFLEKVLESVYFIQQINPMVIVRGVLDDRDAVLVDKAPIAYFSYRYGELRGGTNAIDLGDRFLAFFHSSIGIPATPTKTYFIGAYTFTKQPPYRLLSVSSEPILVPWMYEDAWDPFARNRKIDYCVFPVSLSFLPAKHDHFSYQYTNPIHNNASANDESGKSAQYHPHRYHRSHVRHFHVNKNFSHDSHDHSHAHGHMNETVWQEDRDDDIALFLTMGWQDLIGLSMILSLKEVMRTMEVAIYCDDPNHKQIYPQLYQYYCVED